MGGTNSLFMYIKNAMCHLAMLLSIILIKYMEANHTGDLDQAFRPPAQ